MRDDFGSLPTVLTLKIIKDDGQHLLAVNEELIGRTSTWVCPITFALA